MVSGFFRFNFRKIRLEWQFLTSFYKFFLGNNGFLLQEARALTQIKYAPNHFKSFFLI